MSPPDPPSDAPLDEEQEALLRQTSLAVLAVALWLVPGAIAAAWQASPVLGALAWAPPPLLVALGALVWSLRQPRAGDDRGRLGPVTASLWAVLLAWGLGVGIAILRLGFFVYEAVRRVQETWNG